MSDTIQKTPTMEGGVLSPRLYRILVVDDEELIREVAIDLLHELGHEMAGAESGPEAIVKARRARDEGRPFHLLLLDMTMPEMDGFETLKRIREISPEVRVVLMSGYDRDPRIREAQALGGVKFLLKPYRINNLADIVAATMENASC